MFGINKSVMLVRRRFRAKIILILIFYVMPVARFSAAGQTALSATDSLSATDVTITDSMDVAANSAAADSLGTAYGVSDRRGEYAFTLQQLIVPGVLIGVGVIGLESDWLKFQNREMRNELQEHAPEKFGIDDIGQFVPALSVYALNMAGIKCAHNFKDCTIILGTAVALMAATVYPLKSVISFERPDGSSANSFPSGHTAMAFLGAEFLRREYRDVSPWIGVCSRGGYGIFPAVQ